MLTSGNCLWIMKALWKEAIQSKTVNSGDGNSKGNANYYCSIVFKNYHFNSEGALLLKIIRPYRRPRRKSKITVIKTSPKILIFFFQILLCMWGCDYYICCFETDFSELAAYPDHLLMLINTFLHNYISLLGDIPLKKYTKLYETNPLFLNICCWLFTLVNNAWWVILYLHYGLSV